MNNIRGFVRWITWFGVMGCGVSVADFPEQFDLRDVNGTNYVTSVKSQTGGTCWTHGGMAAIEGNLKRTGVWAASGGVGDPNLSEYHLDWWNGFNEYHNADLEPPTGNGLEVHYGGDYRVVAAYMTRGNGAVFCEDANDSSEYDRPWYSSVPDLAAEHYQYFYPRDIEWFVAGEELNRIDTIKQTLMDHGVMGTCMFWGGGYYSSSSGTHYQPLSDSRDPNHSIAIVGWDDRKRTQASSDGAWLCKNSWRSSWGAGGYFWISYYDKHAGQHPEMGAVSFIDVEEMRYQNVYFHDYHGWRDTLNTNTALNVFVASTQEILDGVSFYTTEDDVAYAVSIYDSFSLNQLHGLRVSQTGLIARVGYHTIDLDSQVVLTNGQSFCVALTVSSGGQAYDRTSEIPVLLGEPAPDYFFATEVQGEEFLGSFGKGEALADAPIIVDSTAHEGESYYLSGSEWMDLTAVNASANFCIRGLALADTDGDGVDDEQDSDDDNDGLPDWWETLYYAGVTNANPDAVVSNGVNTVREAYVAGLNPMDSHSIFKMSVIDLSPPDVIIGWGTVSGRVYSVWWTTNLFEEFQPLDLNLPWTQGFYTNTMATPHGYYQINVQLEE